MRVVVFSVVSSVLLSIPVSSQTLTEYAQLHDHLKTQVSAARDRERRAEQSVERSNALVGSAAAASDNDALAVARETSSTYERALRNARAQRVRRERELREFEEGIRAAAARGGPVGYPILKRQGEITLVAPGSRTVYDGSSLKPGDRISTGPNSTIVLVLPDGAKLEIGPNSVFEYSPDDGGALRFASGSFREVVKCATRGAKSVMRRGYCVERQVMGTTACVCVRGTEYSVDVIDAATVRLEVFEGVVDFLDDAGGLVKTVERGMRITARHASGRWTIIPEGVAIRPAPEPAMSLRFSNDVVRAP